jgi:NADH-quinone oxidoreductase subunit G
MKLPIRVTVCVGSSCHIKGSRDVIRRFSEIIEENGLGGEVSLAGAFCMEHCGEGTNWKVGDELVSSASVEEAEAVFREKVVEPAKAK